MTFVEIRNTMVEKLEAYLGVPINLSDLLEDEPPPPYGIYSVTAPYIPTGESGNHFITEQGDDVLDTRTEQPDATFSFTFNSYDRGEGEAQVFGDDEAQTLGERAIGWFQHVGYNELSMVGVVVVNVMNAGSRTIRYVDQAARQYGFDVRIRYTRVDKRTDSTVASVAAYKKKE